MSIKITKEAVEFSIALFVSIASFFIFFYIPNEFFSGPFGLLGYLLAFLAALISSATIFLPGTILPIIAGMGAHYNPLIVGILCGLGSAIGELTGYYIGFYGREKFKIDQLPLFEKQKEWLKNFESAFLFLIAFIPNPFFDLAGIAAGTLKLPFWRFFIPVLLGKTLKYILTAYLGASIWIWATGQ